MNIWTPVKIRSRASQLGILFLVLAGCSSSGREADIPEVKDEFALSGPFSDRSYQQALQFVDDHGMVDYQRLKENRQPLDLYSTMISRLDPGEFEGWERNRQIAFWINSYNALTLEAIINHYPIQSSFLLSLRYPENSIRQIKGVWDELQFTVMGRKMTLNDIEHGTLRPRFNEPRIHMALVCAARGCPTLRNEPYTAEALDRQLDEQSRAFLADPRKFKIDRNAGVVYLSKIFLWYGEDFVEIYGDTTDFGSHDKSVRSVLHFLSGYLPASDGDYLKRGEFSIEYLAYDWSLNEQQGLVQE